MKLSVISYHTCPFESFGKGYSGGMNVYLRELLSRLSFMDVEVDVYTRARSEEYTSVKNDRLRVHHVACRLAENPSLIDYVGASERFASSIMKRLERWEGVIFSNYWLSVRAALLVRERNSRPMIHMNHTLEKVKEDFSGSRYESGRLRQTRLFWEFHAQKGGDLLLFPSEKDRSVTARYYPAIGARTEVVPPGISEEFFQRSSTTIDLRRELHIGESSTLLLYAGRNDRIKNLAGLLKAMEGQDGQRVCLIIAGGDGSDQKNKDMVRWLPSPSREALIPLMDSVDCVVIPSFYESFGFFGMEALARGKALICARGTFLGDFVKKCDAGVLFDPLVNGSLGGAIENYLVNKAHFQEMSNRYMERARDFTWESSSSRFLQILFRLQKG